MTKSWLQLFKGPGRFFFSFGIITLFFILVQTTTPKYKVSIGAIFRDEARFLKEWIEYHRLVGVDHFYLYNNLSKDNYLSVLDPYIKKGIVELIDWPYPSSDQKGWNKIQCGAYMELVKKKKRETHWLALIDTDEFIFVRKGESLPQFLKQYDGYGGVGINWQLYGTSGVEKIPTQGTLIGSLIKRAPMDHEGNRFIKTIFRPQRVKKIGQPHFCHYKKPFFHVDEQCQPLPKKSLSERISVDKVCINHYTYRDEEFFYTEKARRIHDWFPDKIVKMEPAYDKIEDRAISTHLPSLIKALQN